MSVSRRGVWGANCGPDDERDTPAGLARFMAAVTEAMYFCDGCLLYTTTG
jgi:hypothetical protein